MPDGDWGSQQLDVDAYRERIGDRGVLTPTVATLRRLHRAHVAAIPFENVDVVLGRPIELDIGTLQAKLIGHRRGGYCYEHDLLFAALLDQLGFAVTRLAGRIRPQGPLDEVQLSAVDLPETLERAFGITLPPLDAGRLVATMTMTPADPAREERR